MSNKQWPIKREPARLMLSLISALIIGALTIAVAQAHENRVIGKYKLTVGWLDEPALLNQLNSLDLRVVVSDTQKAVEGLEKTLKTTYAGFYADLAIGKAAPEVISQDLQGKKVKLSDLRGKKNAVLVFYPLDWTPV